MPDPSPATLDGSGGVPRCRGPQDPADRFLGCLFGLALGDALGAPVEFLSVARIRALHGPDGLRDLAAWDSFPAGAYTDDTQMALASADACLDLLAARGAGGTPDPVAAAHRRYLEWLDTQADPYRSRAPGATCLAALRGGTAGRVDRPINDSKGCGGVMRVAPVGLAFPPAEAFRLAADFAAVTHGHPGGIWPAAAHAAIVSVVARGGPLDAGIRFARDELATRPGHESTLADLELALTLAASDRDDLAAVASFADGGWIGEAALGIALLCCLRHAESIEAALGMAVNHGGDSDSTGCIAGGILGALHGVVGLRADWVERVENRSLLEATARSLHAAARAAGTF